MDPDAVAIHAQSLSPRLGTHTGSLSYCETARPKPRQTFQTSCSVFQSQKTQVECHSVFHTIFHCLIDPFETEEDLAQYLNARDELERSSYFDSQPSSRRERRSAGITPRVDDRSNVREIPPYLHIVDGEPFVNKDHFVQDMQASFRPRRSDWLRRYVSRLNCNDHLQT